MTRRSDDGAADAALLGIAEARRIFEQYLVAHPPAGAGEVVIGDTWREDGEYLPPAWGVRTPAGDNGPAPRLDNTLLLIHRRSGSVVQDYFTPHYRRIKAMREVSAAR
jgi:hypothetical protein